ncbi:hypothetical protein B9G55_17910 [Saccharibacillus sp. O16]|nr:hypothetical protein B9G55_17910 [Saccharibacillus sp. O16]
MRGISIQRLSGAIGRPLLSLLIAVGVWVTLVSPGVQAAASLPARAEAAYFTGRTDIKLHRQGEAVAPQETRQGLSYSGRFIPIKELFSGQVDAVRWDAAAKTVSIVNQGQIAVLPLPGSKAPARPVEIVLPAAWVKMENGRALIDIYTLAYVLDRYGDAFDDAEREAWSKKLRFLGIAYIETIPEVRGTGSSIYVTFADR